MTWYLVDGAIHVHVLSRHFTHQGSVATDMVLYSSSTQQYLALGKRCWVFFASLTLIYTTSTS